MNTLLIAINSKYIHTNLAVRSLYAYAKQGTICEYTINESTSSVTADIYVRRPDAVLFSCYIWNIGMVLDVASNLRQILPDTKIILGGPEVTYNSEDVLLKNTFIDMIICGEGEKIYKQLCESEFSPEDINGVTYRKCGQIVKNPPMELIHDISEIPFMYTNEDMQKNGKKLIYYESSRGCPFRCSYCLSSTVHGVRFRSLDMVKDELMFFVRHKVPIIKFVDRTFNADKKRTYELVRFLIDNADETTFHFEIAADIIDEKLLELFKTAPKGLFQFEIGVQSTNPDTISAIDRKTDFDKISAVVKRVNEFGNIHMHLDLIAGLPYEDIESFKRSFNDVFALRPQMLQLGFLKLLHGTKIRSQYEQFSYKALSKPPYEVLANQFISYDDILMLKGVEDIVEKYYNSGVFKKSIDYLLPLYENPFEMFYDISMYFKEMGYDKISHSQTALYDILIEFYQNRFSKRDAFFDCVKFDLLIGKRNGPSPEWSLIPYHSQLIAYRFNFLSDKSNVEKYIPEFAGMQVKDMLKFLRFEPFMYDITDDFDKKGHIIAFNYKTNNYFKIYEDFAELI